MGNLSAHTQHVKIVYTFTGSIGLSEDCFAFTHVNGPFLIISNHNVHNIVKDSNISFYWELFLVIISIFRSHHVSISVSHRTWNATRRLLASPVY